MKAILFTEYGSPDLLQLKEVTKPAPKDDEVLIKVKGMGYAVIHSAEEGVRHLETNPPTGDSFELAVSDSFTLAEQADTMGTGMAILLDKILGLEYEPDGFEEMETLEDEGNRPNKLRLTRRRSRFPRNRQAGGRG